MTGREMILSFLYSMSAVFVAGEKSYESDVIKTSAGDLQIVFLGHGTVMFSIGGKIIHVDPWEKVADYDSLPKADLVLITHEHRDHLDPTALRKVRVAHTRTVASETVAQQVADAEVMKNGEVRTVEGFRIEAVAAYNIENTRENGEPYHPKGIGNGYIIDFGNTRVYLAADTENTPEMKALSGIDVAFLPMNLPNTMTPEMVADAARAFRPKLLYPYHFRGTDPARLEALLAGEKEIEVRVRKME